LTYSENKNLPSTGQSTGKVFVILMTYQENECQQCQEEHSKSHKNFDNVKRKEKVGIRKRDKKQWNIYIDGRMEQIRTL